MTEILLNDKLDEEKRAGYLRDLTALLGTALQKIMRFQGEDTLVDPREDDYSQLPEIAELTKQRNAAKVNTEERRLVQRKLSAALDALEDKETPTRYDEMNLMAKFFNGVVVTGERIGSESLMDFKAVFSARITAEHKRVWTLIDRVNRDEASQNTLREVADLTVNALAKLNKSDPNYEKQTAFWLKKMRQSIRLRSERVSAQRVMARTYFALAFAGLAAPVVDIVGLMDGGWSDNSLFVSSVIYATAWAVIGAAKYGSYSGRTVAMLKTVKQMLKDPKVSVQDQITSLRRKSCFDHLAD
jgi:hypothetical protein